MILGTTGFGNFQVERLTGISIQPDASYMLRADLGFVTGIVGGNADYPVEFDTWNGSSFSPIGSTSGTVNYLGNLSSAVISGSTQFVVGTGGSVSGDQLAVRLQQTANPGPGDDFAFDNVTLSVTR